MIHIYKITVFSSPYLIKYSPHFPGFMTQGKRLISGFQHYKKRFIKFLREYWVCVDLFSFVSSSRFYKKIRFCVNHFLPESSCFHQKRKFMIKRAHLWMYRGITTSRAHLFKSRGIKCMWSLIFLWNTEEQKTIVSSSSRTHRVIRRTGAP